MINKGFYILLGVFSLIMFVLVFLSYRELQSNGFSPAQIAAGFKTSSNQSWLFLWISSLILLILANVNYFKTKISASLFATLGYFVFFVLVILWWLNQLLNDYQKQNNLQTENSFFSSVLSGPLLAILAAVFIYANRYLLLKMLYSPEVVTSEETTTRVDGEITIDNQNSN